MIEELVINQLPAPTWNRLKMNETKLAGLELPQDSCEPRVALEGNVCLNKSCLLYTSPSPRDTR